MACLLALAALSLGAADAATASSGGALYVAAPKIKAVKCVSRCVRGGAVQSGGKIRLRGASLEGVKKVVFRGGRGRRGDGGGGGGAAGGKAVGGAAGAAPRAGGRR